MKPPSGKYFVLIDDNYHYQDEDHRYQGDSFDTLEAAIDDCKKRVDSELRHFYTKGMDAGELGAQYAMFGEDPFIRSDEVSGVPFSARTYAAERCEEICRKSRWFRAR